MSAVRQVELELLADCHSGILGGRHLRNAITDSEAAEVETSAKSLLRVD